MVSIEADGSSYAGRTAWARNLAAPVRTFLSTETGGAMVMLAAAVLALLWANSPWWHSYESVWSTKLTFRLGSAQISTDLRQWVNQGLMTFFFLVVGLEAKRELDMGELRERRRLAVPAFAAIGGFTIPIAIYLVFNAGGPGAHGWGAAMSTDTAFALGALALLTPRAATRMRVFLLTLAVVDDLCALLVIATVYTHHVSIVALLVAIGLLGVLVALHYAPFGRRVGIDRRGHRALGGHVQVGHRPGDLGPGHRAGHQRLLTVSRGSRAGHVADPILPRAADSGVGPQRPGGARLGDLSQ